MSLHPVRHELRTLEQLQAFLRQRAREHLGDEGGAGLRVLRQVRLGLSEVRNHPSQRGSVIARFRRLAIAYRDHPDFDDAWLLPSPDAYVSRAMDLLMTHRGVDIGTAAQLLTAYAEVARCDLVDAAAVVIESHESGEDDDHEDQDGDDDPDGGTHPDGSEPA